MPKNLFQLYILSALIYFAQGINGLPNLAFFCYLKETLGFDAQKIMWIGSLISLAWCVKPCGGWLVDFLGIPKRTWILGSILISLLFTIILGFITYLPLIIFAMFLISTSGALRDIANDGQMCCLGKKYKCTGALQSLQWSSITIASILTGLTGGIIAEHFNFHLAYLFLVPFYVLMLFIAWNYKEKITYKTSKLSFIDSMKNLFKDKNLLLVCAFLGLYNFAPSIGAPLQFIQLDSFHWSKTFIGFLGTIGAIASLGGSWLYYKFSKSLNLRIWLYRSVWLGAFCTLGYLYYTPFSAILFDIVFSVTGMFFTLLVLDFMARESKIGYEALTFALLCSVTNLTGTLNGFIGGWLFPIIGLKYLIIISAICSFACLPLIRRLKT
jgi:MFS family permease